MIDLHINPEGLRHNIEKARENNIVIPTIPLFITRWKFQLGHNLANIQRSRVKDKNFTRIILSLIYTAIAVLFIYFRILA